MKNTSWPRLGYTILMLVLAAIHTSAPAQSQDATTQIQRLVESYYTAIQVEDIDALSALYVSMDSQVEANTRAATQLMFNETDTEVLALQLLEISMHPGEQLAVAFVHVTARVHNADRSDSFDLEQPLVFAVAPEAGRWGLMRVLTFENYMKLIQVDNFMLQMDGLAGVPEPPPSATHSEPPVAEPPVSAVEPPTTSNEAPFASFTFMPKHPRPGDDLVVVSTSRDPDGDPLRYTWFFDDRHVIELEDKSDWAIPVDGLDGVTIQLTVDDGRGGIGMTSEVIYVVSDPAGAATQDPGEVSVTPGQAMRLTAERLGMQDADVSTSPFSNWNNANWGAAMSMITGAMANGRSTRRVFISFDVNTLRGTQPARAILEFDTAFGGGTGVVEVYRVLAPWNAGTGKHSEHTEPNARSGEISWTSQPAIDESRAWASATIAPTPEVVQFDITALLRGWLSNEFPNHGLVLIARAGGDEFYYREFISSDSSAEDTRPRLLVD